MKNTPLFLLNNGLHDHILFFRLQQERQQRQKELEEQQHRLAQQAAIEAQQVNIQSKNFCLVIALF